MRRQIAQLEESEEERKQLVAALQESEEIRVAVFNTTPDRVAVLNERFIISHINEPMAARFGKRPEELIGTCGLDSLPPELAVSRKQYFDEVFRTGQSFRWEDEHRGMYFDNSTFPVREGKGKVTRIAVVARDITAHKRAEEALAESEEKYRNVVERANDGICIIEDGIIKYANLQQAEMWGGAVEEIIDTPFTDYIHPDDLPGLIDLYNRRMAGEQVPSVYEASLRRKDDSRAYVELNIGLINYLGKPAELIITRDITDRKQAEEALRKNRDFISRVLNSIYESVMVVTPDYKIVYVNACFVDYYGVGREEAIGAICYEITHGFPHPCSESDYPCPLQIAFDTKLPSGVEHIHKDRSGKDIIVEVNSFPISTSAGEVEYIVEVQRDITDRRYAEEEHEITVRTALDGFWLSNLKGELLEVNDSYCTMIGYARDELLKMSIADIEAFESPGMVALHMDKIAGQGSDRFETQHRCKDGKIINVEVSVNYLDSGEGQLFVFVRDITERKQAEEALRIFKAISDKAGYGISIVDLEGNVSYSNTSYAKMHGYTPDELIGKHLSIFHDEHQMANVNKIIAKLNREGSYVAEEVWHRRKDNTEFLTLMSGTLVKDENGTPLFMAGTAIDITERKQAEEALSDSEERYRSIVEMSPDGIVTLNVYGIVTSCNTAFVNLIGYPEHEILGKHIAELPVVKPSDIPVVTELFTSLLTLDRPGTVEWQWTRKDGTQKVGEFRMGLIEEAGVTSGFQIVVRDVTGRRQMEEERRRIERLESVGTLAGGIAHDFNNILTGIMGNISLVRGYVEPEGKAAERLLEAERASLRARDLTQQLLTFARGGETIRETTAIGRLIRDSANFALGGSKSTCIIDIPENLWQVHADKGQMNEVIHNLVINADEAMPGGGVINISARNRVFREEVPLLLPKGDYIELSIEDHGVGIPEDDRARIYEPYFTTKEKGSGLGLATTYSIIKNHEGHITVDSVAGDGATFYVYLPATRKPSLSPEEEAGDIRAFRTGKILVMDDEETIRQLLQRALSEVGHDIALATDGDDAIEQYVGAREQGQPFDLVILDLTVPGGMGGMEAMEKLLAIDPDIKSIVSSGYSTDPIMADYRKYGFRDVIAKPYRVRELGRMIQYILQDRHG